MSDNTLEKIVYGLIALFILFCISIPIIFYGTIGYVAYHFISKFW